MSEVVAEQAETVAQDSTPAAAPSEESFSLGGDLTEDTSSSAQNTSSDNSDSFDAGSVTNWAVQDKSAVPQQYHSVIDAAKNQQADYTRKTQDLADQRRQFETQMQQQQQMVNNLQQQVNQNQNQNNPQQNDPYADLRQRLGPDEGAAIDVVRQIFKTESQGIEDRLAKLDQLEQGYTNLVNQQNQGRIKEAADQLAQAREKYGDRLDAHASGIKGLINATNPDTGKNYSITEAFELVSGEKANQAAALRQSDSNTRNNSKRAASSGSTVVVSGEGAPLSDNELVAELRNIGFE
jgi:chromosome segregation ATPase